MEAQISTKMVQRFKAQGQDRWTLLKRDLGQVMKVIRSAPPA